jgi:hypothetical protein
VTYPATAILLRDETPAAARRRKTLAMRAAGRLQAKAANATLAGYWQRVSEYLATDLVRLEELP